MGNNCKCFFLKGRIPELYSFIAVMIRLFDSLHVNDKEGDKTYYK